MLRAAYLFWDDAPKIFEDLLALKLGFERSHQPSLVRGAALRLP
jgi:hypothetical protein